MNPKHAPPPGPSITPSEIYHILFRYKWLILALLVVTVVAALVVRSTFPVPYESDAMLMIKYVHESKPPEMAPDSQPKDVQGESVINSEIKILSSYDLATNVVETLTAKKILARAGGGTNSNAAANLIRAGFVPMADKSDVIELKLTFPDAEMVQPILSQIIAAYLVKHREVHQPEFVNYLQEQQDKIGEKIKTIDDHLLELKKNANINSSIGASEADSGDLHSRILGEKLEAEAEFAGEKATIEQLRKLVPQPAPVTESTNATVPSSNAAPIPHDKVVDYQKICEQLNTLQSQGAELRRTYQPGNSLVRNNQEQADKIETQKTAMEKEFPGLIAMKPAEAKGPSQASGPATADPRIALNDEITKADALAAKIQILTLQLAQVQTNTMIMSSAEGEISQLQNEKATLSKELDYYSTRLEEERVTETVGLGNSNISPVELPTPPSRDFKKLNKLVAGIFFGGLALAFGLPFGIELYLDRSLKRPLDVQTRLGLPFFISIPRLNGNGNGNGRFRLPKKARKTALLPGKAEAASPPAAGDLPAVPATNGHLALWESHHGLQPFYETLRDRLMTYFEMQNLTHKPKLVAVTSCAEGAGVTTTAAGLASSLSEIGDGNVLLVNMNIRNSEAHHFYKGKIHCGLDDVFEKGARENALVQGRLYVAKELPEDDRLPRILPKRFSHLLPMMKASDFDYIIFDMPPISQISITPRLARFMDMVLLVVEWGKTDRDVAARAAAVLSESKTNVGVVLNKNRAYGPRRHHHDI